jgi:hypothetical protein
LDKNPTIGGVSTYLEEKGYVFCETGDFKIGNYIQKGVFRKKI